MAKRKKKVVRSPQKKSRPAPPKKKAVVKKAIRKKSIPIKPSPKKQTKKRFEKVVIRRTPATKQKVRDQRSPLYSKIYRLEEKREKLKKKQDVDGYRKLTNKILHLRSDIVHKNRQLGIKAKPKPDKKKIKEEASEDLSADYILEPATPFTKWETMDHFNKNKWLSKIKWFILDGKRMSATYIKNIEIEALDLWAKTGSPVVFAISYNPKTGTMKYEIY